MLEPRDSYKDYINSVQNKINTVSIKISQYHGSQEYIRNCIVNNRSDFEELGISIDTLFANPYIAYAKIKDLVDKGQLTRVAHYVKSYVTSLRYLTLHTLLFERLNKSLMPYEVYLKLLGWSNLEIAKHIVRGGYYVFGNVGRLYIREKARTFLYNGVPVKLPVDWGTSNKYKANIIEQGKTPFNTIQQPDGIKWHVYHNSDYGYWFWWEKGPIVNRGFFKFFPSHFTRRYNMKGVPFKSIEEILNTTEIGTMNKMLEMMRFDSTFYLNYRRPEKKVEQVEYITN